MSSSLFHPDVETKSLADLWPTTTEPKLRRQLAYVLERSPFYQAKLKGFASEHLVDAFGDLPFTEKQEVLDDQSSHPPFGLNVCVGREDILRIHRTSGTTGRPVLIALTRNDIDAVVRSGSRSFWAAGLRPADVVMHCLNYCMWMGGFTDHLSLEATGAGVVPYGVGNSRGLIENIRLIRPTALHCTISYLAKLELLLEEEFKLPPAALGLRLGLLAGEGGIQRPGTRSRIERTWGFKAMDANYGISDVLSMFGAECGEQAGLHFMGQGSLHVELIDPRTLASLPIEPGVQGEFVLTNIDREAQPLVRFRTHDVVEILGAWCACGRRSFRFRVLGRSDDMIVVRGINLFPSAIGSVVSEFGECVTDEYQVVVHDGPYIDHIVVRIEANDGLSPDRSAEVTRRVAERISGLLNVTARVELLSRGVLPRTDGKMKRLIRV